MLEHMEVILAARHLRLNPGERVETAVTVQNDGNIVDVYSIEVEGLDDSWYELSLSSAALFPGDSFSSTLSINPPRASFSTARTYPFTIKVKSQKDPADELRLSGDVEVGPFCSFTAELGSGIPIRGAESYTISIRNASNILLTLKLSGVDPADNLRFHFDRELPTVPSGAKQTVGLMVDPTWRPLSGSPRPHEFTLKVQAHLAGSEPVVVPGRMDVRPRIPVPALFIPSLIAAIALL